MSERVALAVITEAGGGGRAGDALPFNTDAPGTAPPLPFSHLASRCPLTQR
jgi:hypothetical protein